MEGSRGCAVTAVFFPAALKSGRLADGRGKGWGTLAAFVFTRRVRSDSQGFRSHFHMAQTDVLSSQWQVLRDWVVMGAGK